jgi:hypothetical protein
MLGEAALAGIRLNQNGESALTVEDPPGPAEINESLWKRWWLAEYVPRWEIDNSREYPVRKFTWGGFKFQVQRVHEGAVEHRLRGAW